MCAARMTLQQAAAGLLVAPASVPKVLALTHAIARRSACTHALPCAPRAHLSARTRCPALLAAPGTRTRRPSRRRHACLGPSWSARPRRSASRACSSCCGASLAPSARRSACARWRRHATTSRCALLGAEHARQRALRAGARAPMVHEACSVQLADARAFVRGRDTFCCACSQAGGNVCVLLHAFAFASKCPQVLLPPPPPPPPPPPLPATAPRR